MKTLTILLMFCILPCFAQTSDWQLITKSNGWNVSYSPRRTSKFGDKVTTWTMIVNESASVESLESIAIGHKIRRGLKRQEFVRTLYKRTSQFEFDCRAKTFRMSHLMEMDRKGRVLWSGDFDYDMQVIFPETAYEQIMEKVCR